MAVIKYSGLVDQLRGKLNGTVFSRYKTGFSAYKKGQPKRIGSRPQQLMRQNISLASQSWRNVSPGDRDIWASKAALFPVLNRFGDPVTLSPYNYFMKFQLMRSAAGFPQLLTPNVSDTIPSPAQILEATMTVTQQGNRYLITDLSIQHARAGSATGSGIQQFSISYPYPVAGTAYDSTFFFAARTPAQIDVPPIPGELLQYTDILMPEGWSTFTGAYHLIRLDMWSNNRMIHRHPFYYELQSVFEPPAPLVWDIAWSFSSNDTRYTQLTNQGGDWIAGASGVWIARANELLPDPPSNYQYEMAFSPNLFSTDTSRPDEFNQPRPTLSGTLVNRNITAPYSITPATIADIQQFMNANFTYTSGDGNQYQPVAIRIRRPSDGVWSTWGYSNIWLPIF